MTKVAVVFHSGFGHTKALAEAVGRGAAGVPDTNVELVPVEEAMARVDALHAADAIIFGAPTYMGSASAKFKEFAEATGKIWYEQKWKDKFAGGFTNSASQNGDKLATLQEFVVLAMQHGMIWVGLGQLPGNNSSKGSADDLNRLGSFIGPMAQSNNDQGAEGMKPSDLKTGELYGARVARAARRQAAVGRLAA